MEMTDTIWEFIFSYYPHPHVFFHLSPSDAQVLGADQISSRTQQSSAYFTFTFIILLFSSLLFSTRQDVLAWTPRHLASFLKEKCYLNIEITNQLRTLSSRKGTAQAGQPKFKSVSLTQSLLQRDFSHNSNAQFPLVNRELEEHCPRRRSRILKYLQSSQQKHDLLLQADNLCVT